MIDGLNRGIDKKLTLISAPAGFGKTTLLSDWVARSKMPVAWISLDGADSDPVRFLRYLIAALGTIEPGIGQATLSILSSPQRPPLDSIVLYLIDEIAHNLHESVLVLDDYHFIDNKEVHASVAFLVDHLPQKIHLVVATRVDPSFPLARLRVADQLNELRLADLSFDSDEIAFFFNNLMRFELTSDELSAIESRTEGWIAGLQLAAISMQGQDDVAAFIVSFAGDDHLIVDYLVEEVLNLQPQAVQSFLLHTAILKHLSGPLCDFVLNSRNSTEILTELHRANLFVVPLDNKRRWYRFHHLFADLLRQRFQYLHGDAYLEAHHRASRWYELNGDKEEAITHALEAHNYSRAADLISEFTETALESGRKGALSKWFSVLPEENIHADPELCLYHAWVLFEQGQYEASAEKIRRLEKRVDPQALKRVDFQLADMNRFKGKLAIIRSRMATGYGNVPDILKYSQLALDCLPEDDFTWRANAALSLGLAHTIGGDLKAAIHAFSQARELSQKAQNDHFYLHASYWLVARLKYAGELKRAMEICRQLFAFTDAKQIPASVVGAGLFVNWGDLLYEIDDLEEAQKNVEKGLEIANRGHEVAAIGWCYFCLMRILYAHGNMSATEDIISKMDLLALENDLPSWLTNLTDSWRARFWLMEGREQKALDWAVKQNFSAEGPAVPFLELGHMVFARILVAQNRFQEAERLIDKLVEGQKKGNGVLCQIETLLIKVRASAAQGHAREALITLETALALAEPGGYIRVFLDEGAQIGELLPQLLGSKTGLGRSFLKSLLSAFRLKAYSKTEDGVIEALSERELEVLRCIAAGLSNNKITEALFISLSTVKTHTRNIYGKLNVHSRTEAVVAAKKLGLL